MTAASHLQYVLDKKITHLFAYGSLIWSPEFEFDEKFKFTLLGHERFFCIHSTIHRGTHDEPGIVLGLDKGRQCEGVVFRLAQNNLEKSWKVIFEREMPTNAYLPEYVEIMSPSQNKLVTAVTFVVNRESKKYAGGLSKDEIVRRISVCKGQRGANIDYFKNTVLHLRELGIRDEHLEEIYDKTQRTHSLT